MAGSLKKRFYLPSLAGYVGHDPTTQCTFYFDLLTEVADSGLLCTVGIGDGRQMSAICVICDIRSTTQPRIAEQG
jgi:hypothetical protein